MRPATLAIVAIGGVVAGQAALVALAPSLAGVKPTKLAAVLPLITLLFVPAALGLVIAMAAFGRPQAVSSAPQPDAGRWLLVAIILSGLVMRLMWFGAPVPLEDDFYRYLWDGALTANGRNPYAVPPNQLAAAAIADPLVARLLTAAGAVVGKINFPDLTTIYPGTAQAAFAAGYLIKPFSADGLRAVFLAADLAALAAHFALTRGLGQPPALVALYWLNPLVVFVVFGQVHVDGLLVPLILAALVASIASRPLAAGALLALAAGVKVWPVLLAPLLLRGTSATNPGRAFAAMALCGALTALVIGPLTISSLGVTAKSGLAEYAATWHINNAPYAWASYGLYLVAGDGPLAQRGLRAAVAIAAVAIALLMALRPVHDARDVAVRAMIVSAVVFYLSPAQFPWYALWFLPLAAALANYALLAASATLAAYYTFFPLWETGRGPAFMYGAAFLHSVPVWLWLAWDTSHRRRHGHRHDH
jgi:hypothetical protein